MEKYILIKKFDDELWYVIRDFTINTYDWYICIFFVCNRYVQNAREVKEAVQCSSLPISKNSEKIRFVPNLGTINGN
jgi:hypothetical protein